MEETRGVVQYLEQVIPLVQEPATLNEAAMLLDFALSRDDEPERLIVEEPVPVTDQLDDHQADLITGREVIGVNIDTSSNTEKENIKARRKQSASSQRKRNFARELCQNRRERGLGYQTFSTVEKKIVEREGKKCGEQCKSKNCIKTQSACVAMTETNRKKIFESFWSLTKNEKQIYLKAAVDVLPIKTRRGDPILSTPRSCYNKYFVKIDGQRKQVCRTFFLQVHAIGDKQMKAWTKKDTPDRPTGQIDCISNDSGPKKRRPEAEEFSASMQYYSGKLDDIPKMDSHYSRENSDKLFLDSHDHDSIIDVQRKLDQLAGEEGVKTISWPKFLELFHEKKLAIHKLKKDLCDTCSKYDLLAKANAVTVDAAKQHDLHREEVKACRAEKKNDKTLNKEEHFVLVVDVEKVLPIPKLNNSSQYYMQKIQLKNYSSYDLLTGDVVCYLIQETEGGSDANVFATLLRDLITKKKNTLPTILYVTIWSDGCAAQNRNTLLSNMLTFLAMELNVVIFQKFLVSGHSQNEGDSIHSGVERVISNLDLYSVDDYAAAIRSARLDESNGGKTGSTQYKVEIVTHDKFLNFDQCKFYSNIRPGQKVGDPTVHMLRCLRYTPDGVISYKLSMSDVEWQIMGHKLAAPNKEITRKYQERIPLSASKFRDLQKLKNFVPVTYHELYDSFPHQ